MNRNLKSMYTRTRNGPDADARIENANILNGLPVFAKIVKRFGFLEIRDWNSDERRRLSFQFHHERCDSVGASYPETGGLNESGIHEDIVCDLNDGEIIVDGELFYRNGQFVI